MDDSPGRPRTADYRDAFFVAMSGFVANQKPFVSDPAQSFSKDFKRDFAAG